MAECDVTIIGGGVCGVLAGQRFAQEGWTYKIVEKAEDFGGVWAYRANSYSHLQAHAGLYEWHRRYKLDAFPFTKCPGTTVLSTLRRFATEYGLRDHTLFGCEVEDVEKQGDRYVTTYSSRDGRGTVNSKAVFVACGLLGKQHSLESRQLPGLQNYTGLSMYAGKEATALNYLEGKTAAGKDVVILGSGAFGLEAMEAAHRAGAKSITLIARDRDRWIVPYSQQFKFVYLSHCPFLPRSVRCWMMDWWLSSLYKSCGITHMAPATTTPQNFTGQCNDAFFQYPKQGIAKLLLAKVKNLKGTVVEMESGTKLNADILVTALGHEVQQRPAFLEKLGVGYTTDLHNFAFLGKNPNLGAASDWVWFNVPHGPQKQIDSFVACQKACEQGREVEVEAALQATPFSGCKGEPLNYRFPSGLEERRKAYWRSLSAGRSWSGKAWLATRLAVNAWALWGLVAAMYFYESIALWGWLNKSMTTMPSKAKESSKPKGKQMQVSSAAEIDVDCNASAAP